MRAWHFVADTLRDGSPIPDDGITLVHTGPLVLCESGLHASRHPFDALRYAPGATLCLVECGGTVIVADDKLACSERTIITRKDATDLLRYFARMQALSVVHLWTPPDVVLDYLMTGDVQIQSAAESAARSAAWSAAWSAAGSAGRSAARSAAWSAARSAAESAAESAAWSAARSAAWSAAWSAAESDFSDLINECFENFL